MAGAPGVPLVLVLFLFLVLFLPLPRGPAGILTGARALHGVHP